MKNVLGGITRSKIFLYNSAFASECKEIDVKERKAIRDCINIDFENALIYVNGFQKNKDYILKELDVATIRVFPNAITTTGAIAILAGSAMAIAGLAVGNIMTNKYLGTDIFTAIGQGFRNLFNKNTPEQNETIPSLSGAKNSKALNKSVPFILGRHLIAPYLLGQYTSVETSTGGTDGDTQYLNMLFMVGYNQLQISDVKFGNVLIATDGTPDSNGFLTLDSNCIYPYDKYGTQVQFRQDTTELSLFNQKVIEEKLNIQLLATTENNATVSLKSDRVTAKYPKKVEVEFTLDGLIGYNSNNQAQNASVKFKIDWSLTGADGTWNTFLAETTITRKVAKTMRFVYSKTFNYGELYESSGIPKIVDRVVYLRIQRTNPESTDSNTRDKLYLTAIRTFCYDPDKSYAQVGLVDQPPVEEPMMSKTARLAVRIKAGQFLEGQIDEVNLIAQSLGRTCTYNSGTDTYTWSSQLSPTRNPASLALLAMQGFVWENGLGTNYGYTDSKIDLYSFGKLYVDCEQKGYYKQGDLVTNKYTCDGVILSPKKLSEVLSNILNCARASLVLNGNKYGVIQDSSLLENGSLNPVMVLNSQNIISQSNQKEFRDLPDGFRVRFVNERDNWQESEMLVGYSQDDITAYNAGTKSLKFENLEVPLMTNPDQVYKYIKYSLARLKLRPEMWSVKVSTEGNLIEIGSLVSIQNDTLLVGIGNGAEVTELVYDEPNNPTEIIGIKTDGTFIVTDATKSYGVKITQADGVSEPKVVTKQVVILQTGTFSNFTFTTAISLSNTYKPSVADIVSFGEYDKITTEAICTNKQSNGDGTFELTFIPYDENVYNFENQDTLPEFESKVTPPISNTEWSSPSDPIVLQGEQGFTGGTDGYQDYQFAWNTDEQDPPPDTPVWEGTMPNPPQENVWYDAPPTWIAPQVQPTDAIIWCRTKYVEGSEDNYALRYQGTWDATNNVPQLSDATGHAGHFYRVINSASRNLGSGAVSWVEGKQITHNGIRWEQSGFDTEGLLGYTPANNNLVPPQASSSNQLSDKNFVNSSIATNTANFLGTNTTATTEADFLAWANALSGKTNNDYVFWQTTDANGNTIYKRYKYSASNTTWVFEYNLNNSSFTSNQWATINSGLTSSDKTKIDGVPSFPLSVANGGTGADDATEAEYNIIGAVGTVTTEPTDNSYLALRNQTVSATNGTFRWTKCANIWEWIKKKIQSVALTIGSTTSAIAETLYGSLSVKNSSGTETLKIEQDGTVNGKNLPRFGSFYSSSTYSSGYVLIAQANSIESSGNHDVSMEGTVYIDRAGVTSISDFFIYARARGSTPNTNLTIFNCTGRKADAGLYATYEMVDTVIKIRLYAKITGNYQRFNTKINYVGGSDVSVILSNYTSNVTFPNAVYTTLQLGTDISKNTSIIGTATKATQDESGNNIKASYASSLEVSGNNLVLKNKNGSALSTVTLPQSAWVEITQTITNPKSSDIDLDNLRAYYNSALNMLTFRGTITDEESEIGDMYVRVFDLTLPLENNFGLSIIISAISVAGADSEWYGTNGYVKAKAGTKQVSIYMRGTAGMADTYTLGNCVIL